MAFQDLPNNIRYFFRWLAELWHTWFLPCHSDEEESETGAVEAKAAEADNAPDRSPKPSPPAEEPTSSAEAAVETYAQTETETGAPAESASETQSPMERAMALRGVMTTMALGAVLGQDADTVSSGLARLVECGVVQDLGDGRYLLNSDERPRILRAAPQVSGWLSRLKSTQLEDEVIGVLDELFQQLALKVAVGRNLILHVRQKMWAIWEGHEGNCRVRIFGRPTPEQWAKIRRLDEGAKRFRHRGPQRSYSPDWVSFRWKLGADLAEIQTLLVEMGHEFQQRARHRPRKERKPPVPSPTTETPPQD